MKFPGLLTNMLGKPRPKCGLVAVDGNGTLLGSDGSSISDFTRDIIQQIEALDVPIVLATGRPFEKAKSTLERCGMRRFVLTENGARAVRLEDGVSLYETWLDGKDVAQPLKRIKEALPGRCFLAQLTAEGGLVEEGHPWLRASEEVRAAAQTLFGTVVADVAEKLDKEGGRCAKTYVCVPESSDFAATMADLKAMAGDGWEVREIKQLLPGGTSKTCEVQSARVNKADGLRGLCEAIGVPLENVWAFGDDANDVRMLTEMGWGVRMVNHTPALACVGDDVTDCSNEEDGVAKYLQKHLLQS